MALERCGTIVEEKDFEKYVVKVDGSDRLTLGNRCFLRKLYEGKGMFLNAQPAPQNRCAISKNSLWKLSCISKAF